MNRSVLLLLALSLLTGAAQAASISARQVAACRDAVRNLQEFPDLDYEAITMTPDRIDKHGRAVVAWDVQTRWMRSKGYCRVERNGEVSEVKISEFTKAPPPPSHEDRHRRPLEGITMERDVSRHGKPYDEFDTRDAEDCARACLQDERCQAYNYRVEANRCKLKDDYHEKERDRGTISGEKTAAPAAPPVRMEIRRDYSLRAEPYRDFPARSFEQCRDACVSESRCVGFNYHVDDGACGLKDHIEERRYREGVISGEKSNRR